jgi:hypothetical protein
MENPAAVVLEVPVAEPDGGEYDISEPVHTRGSTHAAAPEHAGPCCKGCEAPLAEGAILCTACGMNQKTGKKLGTAIDKSPVRASAASEAPAGTLKKMLMWAGGIVGGVGVLIGLAFVMPQFASNIFLGIAILGLVLWTVGTIWSIWVATADNIGLRLLCRFVPFVGLVVIIMKSVSDWDEMKVPMLTWIFGMVVAIVGYGLYIGAAVAHAIN